MLVAVVVVVVIVLLLLLEPVLLSTLTRIAPLCSSPSSRSCAPRRNRRRRPPTTRLRPRRRLPCPFVRYCPVAASSCPESRLRRLSSLVQPFLLPPSPGDAVLVHRCSGLFLAVSCCAVRARCIAEADAERKLVLFGRRSWLPERIPGLVDWRVPAWIGSRCGPGGLHVKSTLASFSHALDSFTVPSLSLKSLFVRYVYSTFHQARWLDKQRRAW